MFAKKTVDSILASFSKAVTDLRELAQVKAAEADGLRDQAALLRKDAEDAYIEAGRAGDVAEKLSRLIGA